MKPNRKIQPLLFVFAIAVISTACSPSGKQQPASASPSASASGGPAAATPPAAASQPPEPVPDVSGIWKSETTGKEYRVRIKGDRFYAEWVNIPPLAAKHGAYIRSECQRAGSKWVGTSDIFLPCAVGDGKKEQISNNCRLKMQFEIDFIGKDLIKGRGQSLRRFDCKQCQVLETGWANFEWVPKK